MSNLFSDRSVDGVSLQSILRQRQGSPVSVFESLIYLKALSAALESAHNLGMVHGNLHPGAIVIDRSGSIFLNGFGEARSSATRGAMGWTDNLAYGAPEQARGEPIGVETDVYALGVLLFELLTGRPPFSTGEAGSSESGSGPVDVERCRFEILRRLPPDPCSLNPEIPPALSQVILRALEKSPGNRFASAQAMWEAACHAAGRAAGSIPDRTNPGQYTGPVQYTAPVEQVREVVMPAPRAYTSTMAVSPGGLPPTAFVNQNPVAPTIALQPERIDQSDYAQARRKWPVWLFVAGGMLLLAVVVCGGLFLAGGVPAIGKMLASPTPTLTLTATPTTTPLPSSTPEAPPAIIPSLAPPFVLPSEPPPLPTNPAVEPTIEPAVAPTQEQIASCPSGGCTIYLWNYCGFPAAVMMGTELKSNPAYPIQPGSNFHVHVPSGMYYFTLCDITDPSSCTDPKPATAVDSDVNVYFCR